MQLHDYQREAVEFLRDRWSAALFLDMGLGKTASTLSALGSQHLPVLVVAPKRVAEMVWPEEVARWRPDLSIAVAAGSAAQRRAALTSGADIVVIGRDNVAPRKRGGRQSWDLEGLHDTFSTVVLDELSSFKSSGSARFRALRRFINRSIVRPRVWGLTGTPTPNGLMDLWSQALLLDGGEALGTRVSDFRSMYFTPGARLPSGVITEWKLRPGAAGAIHERLRPLALSMSTEGRVKLPPVTINRVEIELPAKARRAYDDMRRDLVATIDVETISAANPAVMTNKLSQISAGFLYGEGSPRETTDLHAAKVDALREIIDSAQGGGVLVLYRYEAERDAILAAIPRARAMDDDTLRAWDRGEEPVMLAHPAACGHGLNLQRGGRTIVWTSPTWSMEEDQQTNKRLARQGQEHPVVIHYIIGRNTIDNSILARVHDKVSVQEALMAHLR